MKPNESTKIIKTLSEVEKGSVGIAKLIFDTDKKVDNVVEKVAEHVNETEKKISEIRDIAETTKKQKGEKGDKGDRGEKGEKGNVGEKGKDGKNGVDGKDGINGIDGQNGIDGVDGKDGSPDTPDEVVEKVNKSTKVIKAERVDLEKINKDIKELKERPPVVNNIMQGGGGSSGIRDIRGGSNVTVTKVNEIYTISAVSDTDEKVKVSSNDTTAGYLNGKLVAGTGITLTENNNGGNETLTIAATGSGLSSFISPNSTITVGGTLTDPTVDINLAHSNTFTTYQAVNDGTYYAGLADSANSAAGYFYDSSGNSASFAVNGGTGVQATGSAYGGSFYSGSNIYTAFLASDNESSAGYFSNTNTGNFVYMADGSYAINASGIINTDSDYYIGGLPIGVSHWTNDAGYITSAVTSLTGTANQVLVNGTSGVSTTGGVTLTLPQSIATTSTPQFARMGLGVAAGASTHLTITHAATGNVGLEINGIGSQTGHYFNIKNNSGSQLYWLSAVGALGFGSGALAGMANANLAPYLDVAFGGSPGSIIMGAELNATTRTNNTTKTGRFLGAPYAIAQNAVALLNYNSTSSVNSIFHGGGSSITQAATEQFFYTASAINTNTGTKRLSIHPTGRVVFGDDLVESYSARLAVVHTSTTTDATMELRSMAAQTGNILSVRNSAGSLQAYLENTTNPNNSALLRVGRGSNYGNYQERAILGYYSPPDSAAGWDRNQAVIEGVLEVSNASTAFNTYGGYAMYYRVAKSGAGFVENLSGAGGQVEILSGSGNIGSAHGFYSVFQNASTNTVSNVYGIQSYFGQSAANTTTNLYGSQLWFAHGGSANVTNTYGYYMRNSMGTVGTMTNMYGLYMEDFTSKVTNVYGVYILGANSLNYLQGSLEIDGALNHDGSTVGFYGVTPVARSSTYTVTNGTTDRTYDADATTVNELADVVGTLIADLKATGIIG